MLGGKFQQSKWLKRFFMIVIIYSELISRIFTTPHFSFIVYWSHFSCNNQLISTSQHYKKDFKSSQEADVNRKMDKCPKNVNKSWYSSTTGKTSCFYQLIKKMIRYRNRLKFAFIWQPFVKTKGQHQRSNMFLWNYRMCWVVFKFVLEQPEIVQLEFTSIPRVHHWNKVMCSLCFYVCLLILFGAGKKGS